MQTEKSINVYSNTRNFFNLNFIGFALLFWVVSVSAQHMEPPAATLSSGKIQGYIDNGIFSIKNIPYDGKNRLIMVWFHGGAYANGTSNENLVDGARLSKHGNEEEKKPQQ